MLAREKGMFLEGEGVAWCEAGVLGYSCGVETNKKEKSDGLTDHLVRARSSSSINKNIVFSECGIISYAVQHRVTSIIKRITPRRSANSSWLLGVGDAAAVFILCFGGVFFSEVPDRFNRLCRRRGEQQGRHCETIPNSTTTIHNRTGQAWTRQAWTGQDKAG